jgi:hypothetical protein
LRPEPRFWEYLKAVRADRVRDGADR